ncbi:MAG TPA: hypothetical protein ENJ49_00140 [Candidatus Moranbacteria bacterium]|nr:hypothetical protein [Candidatus Moranbacteria bacterium]
MRSKIIKTSLLLGVVLLLGGCGTHSSQQKEERINPFDPTSMVNTYNRSKDKINEATEKENKKINDAMREYK